MSRRGLVLALVLMLAMGGCAQKPVKTTRLTFGPGDALEAEPDPALNYTSRPYPVSYAGSTGAWVCVGAPACTRQYVLETKETPREFTFKDNTPVAVRLNVTWTPASPASDQLRVAVNEARSCPNCQRPVVLKAYTARGPSPLSLDVPQLTWARGGDVLEIEIKTLDPPANAALVGSTTEIDQAFKVDGVITLAPRADTDDEED